MDQTSSGVFLDEAMSKPREPRLRFKWLWHRLGGWWLFEIIAMILSLACTGCILVILFVMEHRPASEWSMLFDLSIPSTLAVLTTVSKSSILCAIGAAISQQKWSYFQSSKPKTLTDFDLFDQASRGPLGSILLVFRKPFVLASWGALATLLLLGVDPSVQQIIQLVPREVFTNDGKASFGLAHDYDGHGRRGSSLNLPGGLSNDQDKLLPMEIRVEPVSADVFLQGAIYRGLFHLDSPAVFNCPSAANCTWPDTYYSLGFASACQDVTAETLRRVPSNVTLWSGVTKDLKSGGGNITTPGGIVLDTKYSATSYQPVVIVQSRPILNATYTNGFTAINLSPNISKIAVFRAELNSQYAIRADGFEITECDISLVAHRYSNVSVRDNKFVIGKEETVPLGRGVIDLSKDRDPLTRVYNVTFNETSDDLPVTMTARAQDISALVVLFSSSRFAGTIYGGESAPAPPQGIGDAFRTGNIAETFGNMVSSMTDHLRSSGNSSSSRVIAEGTSIYTVVHVEVRWRWVIPTVLTQVIAIVFFVLVIVRSSKMRKMGGPGLWKDSTIALLAHNVHVAEGGGQHDEGHPRVYITTFADSPSKVATDVEVIERAPEGRGGAYITGPKLASLKQLQNWGAKVQARMA
ncbi:hypothetical protein QBC43DRAFT_318700 [Cladorrhinum sp. PSN259]|nr:hypothetical protein QBC43DRAFT_318700 [Cladorrhinum sp. PSN259]